MFFSRETRPLDFTISSAVLLLLIIPSFFPGLMSSSVVTLDSIEIYTTHDWLKRKPTVYFQCKGENKTILPDVKEKNVPYKFKAEESWQPLTKFSSEKCKRCGFYEQDMIKQDDIFDEWEFCPSDFHGNEPQRKYTRFVEKEFNATFSCHECTTTTVSHSTSGSGKNKLKIIVVILIAALVLAVLIAGGIAAFKYWQKRRKQQEQARFLKLFEDGDDLEDELELGTAM